QDFTLIHIDYRIDTFLHLRLFGRIDTFLLLGFEIIFIDKWIFTFFGISISYPIRLTVLDIHAVGTIVILIPVRSSWIRIDILHVKVIDHLIFSSTWIQ